jgi:hypothetical protein
MNRFFAVCTVTTSHFILPKRSVNLSFHRFYHVSTVTLNLDPSNASSALSSTPTKNQIGRFLKYFNLNRSSSFNELEQFNTLKSLSTMFRENIQYISSIEENEDEKLPDQPTSNTNTNINTQNSHDRINEIVKKLSEIDSNYLQFRLTAFQAIRYHNYIDATVSPRYPTFVVEAFFYSALIGVYLFDSSLSEFWRNCLGGAAVGYTISLAYDSYTVIKVNRWRKLLINLGNDEKQFYQEKHTELTKDIDEIKTLLSIEKNNENHSTVTPLNSKNQMVETLIFSKFHEKIEKQILEICDGIDEFCKTIEPVIMEAEKMKEKENEKVDVSK